MAKNNWKHKSETMLCKTCVYYVEKTIKLGGEKLNAKKP